VLRPKVAESRPTIPLRGSQDRARQLRLGSHHPRRLSIHYSRPRPRTAHSSPTAIPTRPPLCRVAPDSLHLPLPLPLPLRFLRSRSRITPQYLRMQPTALTPAPRYWHLRLHLLRLVLMLMGLFQPEWRGGRVALQRRRRVLRDLLRIDRAEHRPLARRCRRCVGWSGGESA
jgi:hypothetical protein